MLWLVGVSALVTALSYLAIQHFESKKQPQDGHASQGSDIPVLVVIFLVSLIAAYWINGFMEGSGSGSGGVRIGGGAGGGGGARGNGGGISDAAYEASLVARIPHGCLTGAPPF